MNLPDDPTELEDDAPSCPDCGCDAEWVECENCDGHGVEPAGADGVAYRCEPCNEEGGEWYCERCLKTVS